MLVYQRVHPATGEPPFMETPNRELFIHPPVDFWGCHDGDNPHQASHEETVANQQRNREVVTSKS